LTKDKIDTVKALNSPPAPIKEVGKAMLILLENELKNHEWGNVKKMMNNPNAFIDKIKNFDATKLTPK
jgi:hypothetical protein